MTRYRTKLKAESYGDLSVTEVQEINIGNTFTAYSYYTETSHKSYLTFRLEKRREDVYKFTSYFLILISFSSALWMSCQNDKYFQSKSPATKCRLSIPTSAELKL